ncbi:MAG: HNH endonuclease signature motif containing protein, partial [Ilumatobacter sp.]|uniref:HNH endonuclease signature motif containing protein n=1 Tax=Ilumatobacter sp. TaxID=1967498 RepID=UPI003C76A234
PNTPTGHPCHPKQCAATPATPTSFPSCEIHHIIEWLNLGNTDLENLLPFCTYHHHKVHEGRWRLQLDPSTRQLDVHYPDGSRHSSCVPDIISERTEHAGHPPNKAA